MPFSRLVDLARRTKEVAGLASQLLARRASVHNTMRAHRFLSAISYGGKPWQLDALRQFGEAGYTFDDFLGGLDFLRNYSGPGAGGSSEAALHRAAWNADVERDEARAIPELAGMTDGAERVFLEQFLLGHVTLVVAVSRASASQACEILRKTGLGGERLPVDAFDGAESEPRLKTMLAVRGAAAACGLAMPALRVVTVLCDPVIVCAEEWRRAAEIGDSPANFEAALRGAMAGDEKSALRETFHRAADGAGLARRVRQILGASGGGEVLPDIDPAAGFVETLEDGTRNFLVRFESLHLVGLHLKTERRAPALAAWLERDRPIAIDPPVLLPLQLDEKALGLAADSRSGLTDAGERAAWVKKWSLPPPDGRRPQIVYVFPHIPKTAGSSVASHFREHLNGLGEYVHVRHDTDEAGIRRDHSLPFEWRDARLRSMARVVFGHGVKRSFCGLIPGRDAREIITLREPAERMISHYNFWMHVLQGRGQPVVGFDEWYAKEPRDYQLFWIAHNYLQTDFWLYSPASLFDLVDGVLEEFWMVSTLKTFDRDMQVLMDELGLPSVGERKNVGGGDRFEKRVSLTDDLRARLRAENPFEYRLYDKWLARSLARSAK